MLIDGEEGPRVIDSKEVGMLVCARVNSRFLGRSAGVPFVGGRGAGPGFMN